MCVLILWVVKIGAYKKARYKSNVPQEYSVGSHTY
nr:MAG TPA: hypothetical protein [Caudoviricetes sp.]